tara:strand:+ start:64 stop:975 length:912 start_codon:yes stop_codon:yes gene_type:complete
MYDLGEAFVAVEVGIIHFLYNLKFVNSKQVISGSFRPLVTTLIAVLLSLVPMPYAPLTSAVFVFLLVLLEKDTHHQGVPSYILPLTFLLLSMMMPVDIPASELALQRSASVVIGVLLSIIASTVIWPNPATSKQIDKRTKTINSVDVKYSTRKALGIGLVLSLGLFSSSGAALGAYLFMMIHSPVSKNLASKAWQRLSGTVVGAIAYLPIGLLLDYIDNNLVTNAVVLALVIFSLYMILIYLEHNYTIATAFIMLLILTVSVGSFNLELVDTIFMQRFWYTVIGGGAMVALGFLIPIFEKEMQ